MDHVTLQQFHFTKKMKFDLRYKHCIFMFLSQESVLAQGFQIRNLNNPFYSSVYVILHHLQHMHTLRASPLAHVHIRF
jgi:hypothetical protein